MRPILEYASIVWDGCTDYEKRSLEKLQYEAARIVTGLTRSVSIDRLLTEIGWVSLSDRRKIQKLVTIYKAKHRNLPDYLTNLFPNTVSQLVPYSLRNNNDYVTMARRTQVFSNSFVPSSTALWNALEPDIKNSSSLNIFKSKLKAKFKPPVVPKHLVAGERLYAVYHARIRNRCSNLNNDLFRNHLRDSPACECGNNTEDAEHYFFRCNLFRAQRIQLFTATRIFHPLSTNTLLFGNERYSEEENVFVFKEVQNYIKLSNRFS